MLVFPTAPLGQIGVTLGQIGVTQSKVGCKTNGDYEWTAPWLEAGMKPNFQAANCLWANREIHRDKNQRTNPSWRPRPLGILGKKVGKTDLV